MPVALHGFNLFGEPIEPPSRGKMADKFLMPPFSVLNAREGAWQERKRAWLALGIRSELGRGENTLGREAEREAYRQDSGDYSKCGAVEPTGEGLAASLAKRRGYACPGGSARPAAALGADGKTVRGAGNGKPLASGHLGRRPHSGSLDERAGREPGSDYDGGDAWVASENGSGTSIFDPVLCELACRWFSPVGGLVLDPFAGGSVRGIVACMLGRRYCGLELRPEQIASNLEQAEKICDAVKPEYICGDAFDADTLVNGMPDFLFSCPPYGDLERYSDDRRDLSTLDYPEFRDRYAAIIRKAAFRLKDDRFAAFCVGDFRDKKGFYRNFPGDTVEAFRAAGLRYYNEAILVTAVGSLPIRCGKQFAVSRKLGNTHQKLLVFVKGDPERAAAACEEVPDEGA